MRSLIIPGSLSILLPFVLHFVSCSGFCLECRITRSNPTTIPMRFVAVSSSLSVLLAGNDSTLSDAIKPKISYRSARPSDVSAIAILLNSVFEDDHKDEELGDQDQDTTMSSSENDTDNGNKFVWDTLVEESKEPQLSPEQQFELIEGQLTKRMIDAKKEDSLPHLFLVATVPSIDITADQHTDRVIGFLEMGTLPPPVSNSPIAKSELPYIGNVAVSTEARRRKVGSTLVRLATKIATKWCAPSPGEKAPSFPPFLFLSVERINHDALKFYEKLGFEELKVAKESIEKIYLAQGLD